MCIFDYLNANSGAIQAISTVTLVGITAFYAVQTYKTNKLISRQVLSDIKMTIMSLETNLLTDSIEKTVTEEANSKSKYSIYFHLKYFAKNYSAAAGTVEKPSLVVNCSECNIKKILGRSTYFFPALNLMLNNKSNPAVAERNQIAIDKHNESSIYLRAGERQELSERYSISMKNEDFLHLVKHREKLTYAVSYLNDKEELILENIKKELITSNK